MWTCPECGRTFKKQNQDHYCGKALETIVEYIAAQPLYEAFERKVFSEIDNVKVKV